MTHNFVMDLNNAMVKNVNAFNVCYKYVYLIGKI